MNNRMPLRSITQSTSPGSLLDTVAAGKVGMYVAGRPSTRKATSARGRPIIFDTIKRYLVYLGYRVTWVVNITDVDDKLIVQAQKDGTTVKELAEQVTGIISTASRRWVSLGARAGSMRCPAPPSTSPRSSRSPRG